MTKDVSLRTLGLFGGGIAAIVAIAATIASGIGGDSFSLAVSDLGELAIVLASACYVLWVAASFSPGEPVRRQWLLVGLGMLAFASGDAVWTYYEVLLRVDPPYPGAPDLFYLLEYPLLALALMQAGLAYRGLVPLRRASVGSAVAVGLALVALWFGLLQPHILFAADVALAERAISAFYPAADVLLYLGPALFVALVVQGLGRGRLSWPWWSVVFGVTLLALADTGYSWLSTYDLYRSGSLIDYGWSAGHLFLAVGASLVYDIAHPHTVPAAASSGVTTS